MLWLTEAELIETAKGGQFKISSHALAHFDSRTQVAPEVASQFENLAVIPPNYLEAMLLGCQVYDYKENTANGGS